MTEWRQHSIPGLLSATRICSKCGQGKPDTGHGGETRKWHRNRCPDCSKAYMRKYVVNNKEAHNARSKRYYWEHLEDQRVYHNEYNKRRRQEKPDEARASDAKRYAANAVDLRRKAIERRAANPEHYRAISRRSYQATGGRSWRNYRARKLAAVCSHGPGCFSDAARLMVRVCTFCGSTDGIEADHIKPISKGGLDCADNLQPLCAPCNKEKGDKWPYP